METTTKYYATFYSPDIFCANTWAKEIDSPDPCKVKWPKNAYAFYIESQESVTVNGTVLSSDRKRIGPVYYHPDSKIETIDEVRKNPNAGPCLASNMENNGWDKVIWTRWGNWPQPYDSKKTVILEAK